MNRIKPKKPKIYTRSEWGARPGGGYVYQGDLSKSYFRATCHHDASYASPNMTTKQALKQVKDHQHTHMVVNGWSDIGYHFLIAPGGEIIEGRPLNTQGAHVAYENTGNVGICVMGQLHIHRPTEAQLKAFKELYTWLCWELELDSSCLKGHSDYMATQCPGSLYNKIPETRLYAKKALTEGLGDLEPTQPSQPSVEVDGKNLGGVTVIDGQSFIPIRTLAELMGWGLAWDAGTKTVKITTEKK